MLLVKAQVPDKGRDLTAGWVVPSLALDAVEWDESKPSEFFGVHGYDAALGGDIVVDDHVEQAGSEHRIRRRHRKAAGIY